MRIVMIMTARTFVVEPAYEEWDEIQARNAGLWTKVSCWVGGQEINTVKGDRAYQTDKAGTHPSDGYPCHISFIEKI
jgi:hypothetical protein